MTRSPKPKDTHSSKISMEDTSLSPKEGKGSPEYKSVSNNESLEIEDVNSLATSIDSENIEKNEMTTSIDVVEANDNVDLKEPVVTTTVVVVNDSFEIGMDDTLIASPMGCIHKAYWNDKLEKPTEDNESLDSSSTRSTYSTYSRGSIDKKPCRKFKSTVYDPSSDPNVEVKYFGHQRVVTQRK